MERKLIRLLFFGGLILIFSSCQSIYSPTVVNQPLIDDKGQIQVSGHAGTNGVEVHGAGSPADNLVLMLSYNNYSPEASGDTIDDALSEQSVLEIGGGYYKPLGDKAVVELIAGYGNGSFEDNYPAQNNTLSYSPKGNPIAFAKYHKYFFQPGIGFHGDIFDAGFANRIAIVDHYDMEEYISSSNTIQKAPYETGGDIFWEPAITARIGYKPVKFQTQIGLSVPIQGTTGYLSAPMWISIGIHVDLEPDYL